MLTSRHSHTLTIHPFSRDEICAFRRLAHGRLEFKAMVDAVQRIQMLRTFRFIPPDAATAIGASMAEATALAALAMAPSPDPQAWRLKSDLFASAEPGRCDNLAAMLAASLVSDAARLNAPSQVAATRLAPFRARSADRVP